MCTSMMSIAVVHSMLEIVVTVICCIDTKCFVALTNLAALMPCVDHVIGIYQTMAAYVNLGITTGQ